MLTYLPDERVQKTEPLHDEIVDEVVKLWARTRRVPQALKELDAQSSSFEGNWIRSLRNGLGMPSVALANKLGLHKSAILRFEAREATGAITIENLKKIAEAMDCEFVYVFKPKHQPTFTHLVATKALPFVNDFAGQNIKKQTRIIGLFARMRKHLGHKTGWAQMWGYEKAIDRVHYCWWTSTRKL